MRLPFDLQHRRLATIAIVTVFVVLCAAAQASAVIFVKTDAVGLNDGTSWTDAYADLQSALAAAAGVDTIWVAAGTYKPTATTDRSATFQLLNGVAIYGGFAGTETLLTERDIAVNTTILSGDLGTPVTIVDNSYHIVTGTGTDATALIDGFTITQGYANGANPDNLGAGMYNDPGSPTVVNIIFDYNNGGTGGGMFNRDDASPTLFNVQFQQNAATWGGAIANVTNSNPTLINVNVVRNTSTQGGGGISNVNSDPVIINSIVWGNGSPTNPDISNASSTPLISYSVVEGCGGSGASWDPAFGTDGGNNLAIDPLFEDFYFNDFHLELGSDAINAGDNTAAGLSPIDLDNDPRIYGGVIDIGAYELIVACPPGPVVYVDADAVGLGNGSSWTDAYTEVRDAFGAAKICGGGLGEIWVAEGTYRPTNGADRTASFRLSNGIALYGGFNGTETARSERDFVAHQSILSGDVGAPIGNSDNSYHVVVADGVDATAVLDGVWIRDARGDRPGGGMRIVNGSPTLNNVTIANNTSSKGGGLYNEGGDPFLTNVHFFGNGVRSDFGRKGGGMYTVGGDPVLVNTVFSGNTSWGKGAGLYCETGTVYVVNNSFSCGLADTAVALYNEAATVWVRNTVMWGDRTIPTVTPQIANGASGATHIAYSIVESCNGSGTWWNTDYGLDGGNNFDVYPLYIDDCDNLRVPNGSAAIDRGDNTALYLPATDFDGNPRIVDGVVDMGAFEYQAICNEGPRFYVDKDATGAGDGSSWTDAFTELRIAIASACGGVSEIWVAAGTYKPTVGTDRTATFRMRPGLSLRGGYAGGETAIEQADPEANPTILSGDIGVFGDPADNSYHVVDASYTISGDAISGFTITGGRALNSGGGLYNEWGNLGIRDVKFIDNHSDSYGGGLFALDGDPSLANVTFINNTSSRGGAIGLIRSDARVTNTVISGNSAASEGGGIYSNSGHPIIVGALFEGNSALFGGAISNVYEDMTITNSTFVGNSATNMASVLQNGSVDTIDITNSIIWGNSGAPLVRNMYGDVTFFYCIVQNAYDGGSWDTDLGTDNGANNDDDPLFVNPAGDNFRLQPGSPAINSGWNSAPYLPAYDLDGNSRIIAGTIDRGPYEYVTGSGIDDETPGITGTPGIKQAYPNPFNPMVTLAYENDLRQEVRVTIYDVQGRRVRELVNGVKTVGVHRITWDATDNGGSRVASGVYFVEIKTAGWRDVRNLVLLK